jgi:two-component system, OmpR family, sensor histidine kinase BaeS
MNRLATRLLLAMLAVALLALAIVPISQTIATRQTLNRLESDFRERVLGHNSPRRGPPPCANPPCPGPPSKNADELPFLSRENERLFDLFSDYRRAQRQTIIFGSLAAVLLAVGLALWLTRSIAKPIEAVSKAASNLSSGNLKTRVELDEKASSEVLGLAQDFNKMAASLEQYEGERQAMIADIAHELRTPLTTIQFRLDALEDKVVDFSDDEIVLLKSQVGLLSRLIDDLRTLSLAEAGRLSFKVMTVDLSDLVERVVKQFQDKADSQSIRLRVRVGSGVSVPPFTVQGDADRLTQILNNLLDNAFKVTPSGGWIEVSLSETVSHVVLTVRDSGPGIPDDELQTVFERFVQGRRRDTQEKGSGLGLAIVQTLVSLHGGTVRASNHVGGAQFDVTLPKLASGGTSSVRRQI